MKAKVSMGLMLYPILNRCPESIPKYHILVSLSERIIADTTNLIVVLSSLFTLFRKQNSMLASSDGGPNNGKVWRAVAKEM